MFAPNELSYGSAAGRGAKLPERARIARPNASPAEPSIHLRLAEAGRTRANAGRRRKDVSLQSMERHAATSEIAPDTVVRPRKQYAEISAKKATLTSWMPLIQCIGRNATYVVTNRMDAAYAAVFLRFSRRARK